MFFLGQRETFLIARLCLTQFGCLKQSLHDELFYFVFFRVMTGRSERVISKELFVFCCVLMLVFVVCLLFVDVGSSNGPFECVFCLSWL